MAEFRGSAGEFRQFLHIRPLSEVLCYLGQPCWLRHKTRSSGPLFRNRISYKFMPLSLVLRRLI
jgi:hypothetical protein